MRTVRATALLFLIILPAFGQPNIRSGAAVCAEGKQHRSLPQLHTLAKSTSPGSPRHSYDALHYALDLDLYKNYASPFPKSFSGTMTLTLKADTLLSSIALDAVNTSLAIDSVKQAGVSFIHSGNVLTIQLNRTYLKNETLSVTVHYRHKDVADGAFFVGTDGMIFTDAEPEGARRWFPCWDKPYDKATMELKAKVRGNVKLGSNGRLKDTLRSGDSLWFHWVSRDPVPTYLIVISSKVNYNLDIVHWKKLSNPNDSVPMFFYWNTGENKTAIDSVKKNILPMTTQFSLKFGEHPFEKNGFATLNNQFFWGGMENQTLTSLTPNGYTSEFLIAHEYGHQWFGDLITCATWADIWLNEGFATYSEAVWAEYKYGQAVYRQYIKETADGYLAANPGRPIYVPAWVAAPPSINELFNTAVTYNKGAAVLHMLRYVLGDSLFFDAVHAYGTDPSVMFGSITTDDFIQIINARAKQDLQWFFRPWLKAANHPNYAVTYRVDKTAKSALVKIRQVQSDTTTWTMPVVLSFRFQNGADTLVKVWNTTKNDSFSFAFSSIPVSMSFDPNDDILLKKATVSKVVTGPLAAAVPGTMYAVSGSTDGGKLYTVNTSTGALTPVLKTDVPHWGSLRIHPTTKELIGYNNLAGTGGAFYRMSSDGIDAEQLGSTITSNMKGFALHNDSMAYLGAYSGAINTVNIRTGALTELGTNGVFVRPGGLALNPVNGTLWMSLRNTTGAMDNIYKVNRTTGLSTLVGSSGLGAPIIDIVFDKKGTLYGLSGAGAQTNTLVRIDTATGLAAVIGSLGRPDIQAIALDADFAADIHSVPLLPTSVQLEQNYPNPFNPTTVIRYAVPAEAHVSISIVNLLGQTVAELVNERQRAGWKQVEWNAGGVASGIYFCTLRSGSTVQMRKMILMK
ncbi:MAG: T9SS type A sorting domain-containing protein [Bacteroidetes bacterium]|nr:T9SS type A sorting domain-containing protein [Bacteroidota bacterium]